MKPRCQSVPHHVWVVGLLCVMSVSILGCRGGRTPRTGEVAIGGRIVKGGQPLPLDPNLAQSGAASVQVGFFQLVDGGFGGSQSVVIGPDGTFKTFLPGPGRYRVAIEHYNGGADDLLRGRFSGEKSPIEIDVADKPPEIVIELDDFSKKKAK